MPPRICYLTPRRIPTRDAKQIIGAVRAEFQRHKLDTFVDNPPAIAHGGKGVVVPGCAICKVRLNTTEQFMQHVEMKVAAVIATNASE